MGILKGKRTSPTVASSIFRFFYAQTGKDPMRQIHEIALLRRIDPFPQSPSGSVLTLGLCFELIVYGDYSLLLALKMPKGNRSYSYSFCFSGKQHGAWYMSCLFAQKKKSECNRKKKRERDLQRSSAIHSQRKKYHTESLSYPSRCYKVPGKSP